MEKIIERLNKENVAVWRITKKRTEAVELYFIKKKLDLPRFTQIEERKVEIFRDFEEEGVKYRGSTVIFIDPETPEEELAQKIRSAYYAASFVKNPFYELPEKNESEFVESKADYRDLTPEEAAGKVADVLIGVNSDETAFINSAEIFIRRSITEIRDSKGTHVSYGNDSVWGEFVTQCTDPLDVEQYRQFSYGDLDLEALKVRLQEGIRDVRLRAQAKKAPKAGTYNVILTGENLREVLRFYESRSSSAMIYPEYSTWKIGDVVQGDTAGGEVPNTDVSDPVSAPATSGAMMSVDTAPAEAATGAAVTGGEKLNLSLRSALPFSDEGISLTDRPLITEGRLCTIHGGARFAYYLGIEPTGSYEKLVLDAGTMSYEDMKKSGALEAVSFSDFQMDEMDGHFAGELRLALQTAADGTVTPLSGGSVNGSILASQAGLIFSKEQYKDSSYEGPLAVLIPNVTVAGE